MANITGLRVGVLQMVSEQGLMTTGCDLSLVFYIAL